MHCIFMRRSIVVKIDVLTYLIESKCFTISRCHLRLEQCWGREIKPDRSFCALYCNQSTLQFQLITSRLPNLFTTFFLPLNGTSVKITHRSDSPEFTWLLSKNCFRINFIVASKGVLCSRLVENLCTFCVLQFHGNTLVRFKRFWTWYFENFQRQSFVLNWNNIRIANVLN